jgi:hypothetical protein
MLKYDYQRSSTVLLGKSIKGLVWYCLSTSSKGLACYSIKRLAWYCTNRLAWYSIKRLAWYSIKRLAWYSLKRLAWYYQCLSTSIEGLAWYKIRRLAWYCCITSIGKGGQRKMRQFPPLWRSTCFFMSCLGISLSLLAQHKDSPQPCLAILILYFKRGVARGFWLLVFSLEYSTNPRRAVSLFQLQFFSNNVSFMVYITKLYHEQEFQVKYSAIITYKENNKSTELHVSTRWETNTKSSLCACVTWWIACSWFQKSFSKTTIAGHRHWVN